MRIAITGANGQLGQSLCARLANDHEIVPLNQPHFEMGIPDAMAQVMVVHPDLVIHTASNTDVDGCAREPALVYRVNGLGTRFVALACQQLDIPLVSISTNEVFDGTATVPYREYDMPNPINPYGYSKWVGEQAVVQLLRRYYIVRVAWLFGGERNFVQRVRQLAHESRDTGLRMVTDEVSSPTYTVDVADAIAQLIEQPYYGIYHLVNAGECSRFEFAQEILRQSGYGDVPIAPITLADYRRASTPPPYAPLANVAGEMLGLRLRPWQEALAAFLDMHVPIDQND